MMMKTTMKMHHLEHQTDDVSARVGRLKADLCADHCGVTLSALRAHVPQNHGVAM